MTTHKNADTDMAPYDEHGGTDMLSCEEIAASHSSEPEAAREPGDAGSRFKRDDARRTATAALLAIAGFLRVGPPSQILQDVINEHIIAVADDYLAECKEMDGL